jgi:DNA-binding response OmpR family regulator
MTTPISKEHFPPSTLGIANPEQVTTFFSRNPDGEVAYHELQIDPSAGDVSLDGSAPLHITHSGLSILLSLAERPNLLVDHKKLCSDYDPRSCAAGVDVKPSTKSALFQLRSRLGALTARAGMTELIIAHHSLGYSLGEIIPSIKASGNTIAFPSAMGEVYYDPDSWTIALGRTPMHLRQNEARIIEHLLASPGDAFTHKDIARTHCSERDYIKTEIIRLNKRLGNAGLAEIIDKPKRGFYALNLADEYLAGPQNLRATNQHENNSSGIIINGTTLLLPRALEEVLRLLIASSGKSVVSQANSGLSYNQLTFSVHQLRKILPPNATIETVRGKGYRFIFEPTE